MKLLSLKLENFMGVKTFDFAPHGQSVTVLGANDSGKSTLETAYWWLLTGKNTDQSTDFDVYPYGAPEGVEASVTGEFEDDNGDTFALTRTYKREFTRRKGDAESVFKGNKTSYLINGVPETQTKFKAFVAEHIAPEDKLLVLGKLHYFATDMRWDARRAVLLDVFAPHLSDADIIKAYEELAPLGGWIGAMTTVDDMARQANLKAYRDAGSDINALRRINYAEQKERINAQKRAAYAEQHRRKTGEQGQEIIDKPTYNKLTKDFLSHGGLIIRGEEAVKHLEKQGAYASYFMGGNFAFIRDDATVSDVLEEMYHALQDRKNMFAEYSQEEMLIRREIDAQKYLISVAERYKIPIEETNVTKQNLANYEERLKERLNGKEGQKE